MRAAPIAIISLSSHRSVAGVGMIRRRLQVASLVGAALLSSSCPAAEPGVRHPIVGVWRLSIPGVSCVETIEFRADGTTSAVSSGQRTLGVYTVSDRPERSGRYRVSASVTQTNAEPDCFGSIAPTGVSVTTYVQVYAGNRLFVCPDATSVECYGPYVALAPKAR